jgi:autotransporter strand-loop-strand O-heptosyltransferase
MVKRHYDNKELLKYTERDKSTTNLAGKEILVHLDSFCLGDTICYASYLDAFIEHHNPKKIYVSTFFMHLFESNNDRCEFVSATRKEALVIDKLIDVGYHKESLEHTLNGMLYATRDTMRIPHNSVQTKNYFKKYNYERQSNKIVIAPESIKNIAKWDAGWQGVVNYLVDNDFEVFNVSYEDTLKLKNVKDFHGFDDLGIALKHILEAKVFIGLSSGLAWLAWAYDIPVVMVSGFTKPHNEFDCFRVVNEVGCSGCFNIFKNIQTQCPIFIGTERQNECHKLITPAMVIKQVDLALKSSQ